MHQVLNSFHESKFMVSYMKDSDAGKMQPSQETGMYMLDLPFDKPHLTSDQNMVGL